MLGPSGDVEREQSRARQSDNSVMYLAEAPVLTPMSLSKGDISVLPLAEAPSLMPMPSSTSGGVLGPDDYLWDSGATHIIVKNSRGAIPGSWKSSPVSGLRLGDESILVVTGSVLKCFDVGDGKIITRRVLVAPKVMCN